MRNKIIICLGIILLSACGQKTVSEDSVSGCTFLAEAGNVYLAGYEYSYDPSIKVEVKNSNNLFEHLDQIAERSGLSPDDFDLPESFCAGEPSFSQRVRRTEVYSVENVSKMDILSVIHEELPVLTTSQQLPLQITTLPQSARHLIVKDGMIVFPEEIVSSTVTFTGSGRSFTIDGCLLSSLSAGEEAEDSFPPFTLQVTFANNSQSIYTFSEGSLVTDYGTYPVQRLVFNEAVIRTEEEKQRFLQNEEIPLRAFLPEEDKEMTIVLSPSEDIQKDGYITVSFSDNTTDTIGSLMLNTGKTDVKPPSVPVVSLCITGEPVLTLKDGQILTKYGDILYPESLALPEEAESFLLSLSEEDYFNCYIENEQVSIKGRNVQEQGRIIRQIRLFPEFAAAFSPDELLENSEAVIIAEVTSSDLEPSFPDRLIAESGTAAVQKVLYGNFPGSDISFRKAGGIISAKDYEASLLPVQQDKIRWLREQNGYPEHYDILYYDYLIDNDVHLEPGHTYLMYLYEDEYGWNIYGYGYGCREILSGDELLNNTTGKTESLFAYIEKWLSK